MFLNSSNKLKRTVRGSTLVIAIFIIVIMSLLGVALVRMISVSSQGVAYEVLGTKAFQAAQSGMQWELQQVFPLGGGAGVCDDNDPGFAISNADGMALCTIKTTCKAIAGAAGHYILTSTGQCGDGNSEDNIVAVRTVEVQAKSL